MDLRLKELNALYPQLDELRSLVELRQAQLTDLQGNFESVEQDRVARGDVIETQGRTISELQAQVDLRLKELNALYPKLDESQRAVESALRAIAARDEELSSGRKQAAELEHAMELTTMESRRLQNALFESATEIRAVRAILAEREEHIQQEMARRDADMEALGRRWWWKLGKLIKTL